MLIGKHSNDFVVGGGSLDFSHVFDRIVGAKGLLGEEVVGGEFLVAMGVHAIFAVTFYRFLNMVFQPVRCRRQLHLTLRPLR